MYSQLGGPGMQAKILKDLKVTKVAKSAPAPVVVAAPAKVAAVPVSAPKTAPQLLVGSSGVNVEMAVASAAAPALSKKEKKIAVSGKVAGSVPYSSMNAEQITAEAARLSAMIAAGKDVKDARKKLEVLAKFGNVAPAPAVSTAAAVPLVADAAVAAISPANQSTAARGNVTQMAIARQYRKRPVLATDSTATPGAAEPDIASADARANVRRRVRRAAAAAATPSATTANVAPDVAQAAAPNMALPSNFTPSTGSAFAADSSAPAAASAPAADSDRTPLIWIALGLFGVLMYIRHKK